MNDSFENFSASDDALETAAAEWLCERAEGFAPGRAAAFAAWRAADPRHEMAVAQTEQALALLDELPAVRAPLEARLAETMPSADRVAPRSVFRPAVWLGGLAAALALAAGLWFLTPARPAEAQRFATAAARQQQIALNDGSVVDLNVNSDVRVRLLPHERQLTLAAGEAHFAVAHDTARPFIVTAAGVSVRAVGTAFSVRVGEAGVEVLVTEGRVEVTREGATSAMTAAPGPMHLAAGERTVVGHGAASATPTIETVPADALNAAVRWHSRLMTFSDLPLRDVVVLFNRRNSLQLVLADEKLGDQRIGGTFAADQVEAFVRLLENDGDILAERRGSAEIALRRAP